MANSNLDFPAHLAYSPAHIWVRQTENGCVAGITDYARSQLGDVVYIDVEKGSELGADEEFGTVESAKTVSSLKMPLAGKIVEINPALADDPGLINSDCYGAGWIARIEPAHKADLSNLLNASAYEHILGLADD